MLSELKKKINVAEAKKVNYLNKIILVLKPHRKNNFSITSILRKIKISNKKLLFK